MIAPTATPAASCPDAPARAAVVVAVLAVPGQRRPVRMTCRDSVQQAAALFFGGAPVVRGACDTPILDSE